MICRLCLKESINNIQIFDDTGKRYNIAFILKKHFWFEPCMDDSISNVICQECWHKVNDFHQFYVSVELAHSLLSRSNCNISEVNDNEIGQEPHPTEQVEIAFDIKEEYIDNAWLENKLNSSDSASTKTELQNPLEVTETSFNHLEQISKKAENDTDNDFKQERTNNDFGEEEGDKLLDSRKRFKAVAVQILPAKRLSRLKRKISNDNSTKPTTPAKKRRKPQKMITSRDEELLKKHISMGCELCPFVAEDFIELTNHFKIIHDSQKPYVICCGRKLNKRFLIVQHAYKHEDPEYYKCKECNKVFSDGYVLRSHMLANHASEEELTFSCDKCPKKFSRRYLLELHKPSHIPVEERKFWCKICPQPKVFASDHLLQIHTNMRHTKAPNVCHVCAKEIRDNQAFEKHVRLHFEDSGPRVKCPHKDCDRWLKDMDNLKQHLRRHNDEGKTFICKECGKVCKNGRSLASHNRYAHTNEIFTCEECNKTFKKAITLREHMAQHTGETLYKCPFCARTFNSNANMHSHKKKMHPQEWDIWRKTKRGSSQQLASALNVEGSIINTKSLGLVNARTDVQQSLIH